jgi:branched-chain amino acid transport system ATP-binding protein
VKTSPNGDGLVVSGLTRRFTGLVAVNNLSFEVIPGSITALIGPNGAGKTTCFNIIAGAIRPTAGSVHWQGKAITGLAPERICSLGIARTFQIVKPLLGMSVLENVMVGALHRESRPRHARLRALAVLERVGLADRAQAGATSLTLPDRKMLELAKALATEPTMLMLDEVMAGLRPAETDRIVTVLRELNAGGLTILLVEHLMRVVMALARTVVVLHHGEKLAEGPPLQVVSDPQVVESYLGRGAAALAGPAAGHGPVRPQPT